MARALDSDAQQTAEPSARWLPVAEPPSAGAARRERSGAESAAWPSLLVRLVGKLREVGPRYALAQLLDRLIPATVFRWAPLLVLSIAVRPGAFPLAPARGRLGSAADAPLLCSFGHAEEEIRERFVRGDEVFLLEESGSLVAYVWWARHSHRDEEAGIDFRIGQGELWLYDAMVARDRRGEGAHPNLLQEAKRWLAARGIRRMVLAIDPRNRNSLVSHYRAGAQELTRLRVLRLFGWTTVRTPPGPIGGIVRRGDAIEVSLRAAA